MTTGPLFKPNTTATIDGTSYWIQDAGASYSIEATGNDTYRFEVRAGDVWSAVDPTSKNRSEIASTNLIPNGTPIHISYTMDIEPGAPNTAAWLVVGQLHQNDTPTTPANSPPFSINLAGEKMSVNIGYTNAQGVASYLTVFTDSANIVRGHNYAFDINVVFDPNGNGHLVVTRDGVQIVDYNGPLGFTTQQSVYWKEGVYRAAAPETIAVDYSHLSVTTGTPIAMAAVPSTAPQVVNQYSNTGALLSTTTETFGPTGALLVKSVANVDGTKEVLTYQISGQTYASTDQYFDSANNTTKLVRYHADGTMDYQQVLNANGTMGYTSYDAKGAVLTQTTVQVSGAKTVTTYGTDKVHPATYASYDAHGTLLLQDTFNADGSKVVQNFGITGHTYVSDYESYDSSGHLIALIRYHADGTMDSQQFIGASGSTDYASYDAHGNLVTATIVQTSGAKTIETYGADHVHPTSYLAYDAGGQLILNETFNADGSKIVRDYGVTGRSYVSDTETYDSTGHLSSMIRYHADGTLDYKQTVTNGVTTTAAYDAHGAILTQTLAQANGSYTVTTYGTDKIHPSAVASYDTTGKLTLSEMFNADGSSRIQHFGITGQTYTSDSEIFNASGTMTAVNRYHADGTLDYSSSPLADGSQTTSLYDAKGHLTETTVVKTSGASVVTLAAANLTVTSGAGNDTYTSFHNDTFAFKANFGKDVISGFNAGDGAAHDTIQIDKAVVADFQHLSITQVGADTVIHVTNNDTITLKSVAASVLTAHDFFFH